ncbi:tRNA 4-thiouridine(8) synthase ThiI [Candidatus Woesearchaeota archaeon]|nr:tRNA 4-thiouridine(8) synthase ThiI [Candidatus Woesearchaeota archaeon]
MIKNPEAVVIHYSEIALKKGNRKKFELKLVRNIEEILQNKENIKRLYGRIIIFLNKNSNIKKIEERLKKISGISHFAFAVNCNLDIKECEDKIIEIIEENKLKAETFAVKALRSNKEFKYNSQQINEILGEKILKKYKWKVNLNNPEICFYTEITEKDIFIYINKTKSLGGLPVGVTGKVISLISGGIDSPVASYMLFNRGCEVILVHFQNETITKKGVESKIKELAEKLSQYQPRTKLYIVKFGNIQKEIIKNIPAKYRMIVYRRIMFEIGSKIAEKEHALGLVTGDSIGQVASQTLENLNVIYDKAELPVFSPLIGFTKEEIVKISREIGTYEISIQPYEDCCSYYLPEHPEIKSDLKTIEKAEKNLNIGKEIKDSVESAEIITL